MNSFIPKITLEFSISKNSVNFLDLIIAKNEFGKLFFRTYQKSINTYQYLPRHSCHNPATIRGYIRGELIRYCRTNTRLEDRRDMAISFFQRLRSRAFSRSYLSPVFQTVDLTRRFLEPTLLPVKTQKRLALIIPYFPNMVLRDFKNFIKYLKDHPYSKKLNLDIFLAYRKNRNVLDIATRSNVSPSQIKYLDL